MNASAPIKLDLRGENPDWQAGAKAYLDCLGKHEYERQRRTHFRGHRSPGIFICWASNYYQSLPDCLILNDEELFNLL